MIIMTWIKACIIFSIFVHVEGINTLYQATRNMSESSWNSVTTSTKYGIRNVLACAGKCQIRHSVDGNCNAFKYDNSSDLCDMGLVTFLEDPGPGETAVAIMVDTEVIDSLGRVCRGGESCCGPEATRTCGEGEGDCQGDACQTPSARTRPVASLCAALCVWTAPSSPSPSSPPPPPSKALPARTAAAGAGVTPRPLVAPVR